MLYRTVPSTGAPLSILGFGAMRLPQKDGAIDRPAARSTLAAALAGGITLLDTAWPYHGGESEPFLGEALAGVPRESYALMTKLPCWLVKTREDLASYLPRQLERLGTAYLDYYLLHSLDRGSWATMCELGALAYLEEARDEGLIRHVGFSFHDDLPTFRRIVDAHPWDVCLIQYNYLDQSFQAGSAGLAYAVSKGIGVMVMEPLRGGALASPVPPEVQAVWDRAPVRRSPAAWALRWVWDHPGVVSVLSGMGSVSQVEENCATAREAHPGALSPREHEAVREAASAYRSLLRVACTGCRYCLPCPEGVDIPSCFELYNARYLFKDERAPEKYATWLCGGGENAPSDASLCTQCGKCVVRCPQGLDIPTLLGEVDRDLRGQDAGGH